MIRQPSHRISLLLPLWLLIGLVALPAASQAATGFVPESTVGPSTTNIGVSPNVASAPDGTAFMAWIGPGTPGHALVAVRPPGGTWATQDLGATVTTTNGLPIAVAGDGTATVLSIDGTGKLVSAYTRPPGGAFALQKTLNDGTYSVTSLALAVNASGDAVGAWHENTAGANWQPRASYRAAGVWTAPAILSGAVGASPWVVADINDAGRSIIGLWHSDAGHPRVRASIRPAGGPFPAEATALNVTGTWAIAPSVAITASGAVVVGFVRLPAPAPGGTVQPDAVWRVAPAGSSTFGPDQLLSAYGKYAEHLTVAAGPGDQLHAAWTSAEHGRTEYGIGSVSSTGVSRQLVSPVGENAVWPKLSVDAAGNRFVAWLNLSSFLIQGAYRPAGANDFGTPQTAPGSIGVKNFTRASVSADGEGNHLVGWARPESGTSTVAQAAGFDVSPPTLSGFTVPGPLAATLGGSFGVTARDTWSTPTVQWAFGDGASESGATVAHAYGGAGAFTASATATDAVGNTASLSAPVQVNELDADGDGYATGRDCNDGSRGINPGARDVPGNGVDENCDGRDGAFGTINVNATLTWVRRLGSTVTRIQTLGLEGVRDGDVVRVVCKGKGCKKKANRTRTLTKVKRGKFDLTGGVKGLKLKPKAKLSVTVERGEHLSRIFTYEVRRGKNPRRTLRCQVPGAKSTQAC